MSKPRKKKRPRKRVLALPDLEQSKAAVLNSLTSKSGQRTYDHAINDFVEGIAQNRAWPSNRTVVLRYRIHLEQKQYAPTTINLHLAAVRRVAYVWGNGMTPKVIWGIVREAPHAPVSRNSLRMTFVAPAPVCATLPVANWIRFNSYSACLHPDYRTIPRVQAKASGRCQ